ncbi:chemotaxis-specific protein-glutamate methyltransferase CheB [Novosphingobium sp. KN65.2]|uniref:chemotaxis-specific protein-glutamate methyltransferase CheB n=1 Tax=Novosphingobium sp. KN65.2 TaxID=1478134 RepID=UPI0005DB6C58|nr:chemotaxis-specific protein-glutamate methyltransferase CheB [Novosphingobium sp. KN65.2]CDO36990.1 Chemotaxis response regulator protein-glutamate methylesterase of group 1 operon [Novosphingobium sp. KN65.2]
MHDARVLVVDDSAAMRALFCDVLEQTKNIRVVGTAANAAEARDQIAELMPNVVTLDVEMPGMSGIEFLEEIMTTNPLPVVMLSSLTQSGTETSLKAFELGAVECFPKPLKATPEQFAKTVGKLGKIVLAAANSNVRDKPRNRGPKAEAEAGGGYVSNGKIAAFSASMGGVDALTEVLSRYPKNCPPTVIILQTEPALAQMFIDRANKDFPCAVKAAADGAELSSGTVYIASDPGKHVIVEPGAPARLRLVERDPVEGFRPSATLLFGSIARASMPAIGAVLTGMGEDGAKGLKLLQAAGCRTLAQDRNTATVPQAPAAAVEAGAVDSELRLEELAADILANCGSEG